MNGAKIPFDDFTYECVDDYNVGAEEAGNPTIPDHCMGRNPINEECDKTIEDFSKWEEATRPDSDTSSDEANDDSSVEDEMAADNSEIEFDTKSNDGVGDGEEDRAVTGDEDVTDDPADEVEDEQVTRAMSDGADAENDGGEANEESSEEGAEANSEGEGSDEEQVSRLFYNGESNEEWEEDTAYEDEGGDQSSVVGDSTTNQFHDELEDQVEKEQKVGENVGYEVTSDESMEEQLEAPNADDEPMYTEEELDLLLAEAEEELDEEMDEVEFLDENILAQDNKKNQFGSTSRAATFKTTSGEEVTVMGHNDGLVTEAKVDYTREQMLEKGVSEKLLEKCDADGFSKAYSDCPHIKENIDMFATEIISTDESDE
jgi:hypothetical protein